MRKIVNSVILLVWVLAQTLTAAHAHVHLPGHMMPAVPVAEQPVHMSHQHDHAAHQHADAKPGCGMHADNDVQKSADDSQGDTGVKTCCKDIHCQSADVLKGSPSSLSATSGEDYHVLAVRQVGRSPSFIPPPPNSRS